ncbi:MAG TPA: hypothetical protein VFV87_20495, partial [Pirellulaceae bacterium]|nr:hypothetical protein [Pirellulaceae bacterium]
ASLRTAALTLRAEGYRASKSVLGRLAREHRLGSRAERLSRETWRAIDGRLARGVPLRQIAREVPAASLTSIRRRAAAKLWAEALREKLDVVHRRTTQWRCPRGALVTTDPCVCCGARRPRAAGQ